MAGLWYHLVQLSAQYTSYIYIYYTRFVKWLQCIRCLLSLLMLQSKSCEHIPKIDHVLLQALKGSKIQVETSYCSQDPRDRFNSSHYSYRTHHPTYRVMMSFLFYLCLFCTIYYYHYLYLFFKTVLKTCLHLTFKATITIFPHIVSALE